LAISADGKTVIGQFAPGNPFTWRGGETARFRPSSNENILDQYAQGVSANGKVIVGKAAGAYVWIKGKGMKSIGNSTTFSYGVSEDGTMVACQDEGKSNRKGYIWSESGVINLETFAPTCISGDGKVVAGIRNEHGSLKAFYFHNQVSEALPVPDEFSDSAAFGVSRDGGTIVGDAFNARGTFAAKWVQGKFEKLQNFGREAVAKSVTRDGTYIGGYIGSEAALWTPEGKAVYLELLLKNSGASTSGWKFESINGIARVGDTIFCTGWGHQNGRDAGYYASFRIE
jgi:uncharacterized membrane protein